MYTLESDPFVLPIPNDSPSITFRRDGTSLIRCISTELRFQVNDPAELEDGSVGIVIEDAFERNDQVQFVKFGYVGTSALIAANETGLPYLLFRMGAP